MKENHELIRKQHDFSNVNTFVYSGRISYEKGCDILSKLALLLPNYKFELIGDTNCGLDISKFPNNVKLLGIYDHKKVLNKLNENVIFLFLSRSEGFSNSIVEAMSKGLPIITTNVGANMDMIENKGGLIFNLEELNINLESCAERIKQYVSNHLELEKAGEFNTRKVRLFYSIENVINQILNEYFDN